MMVQTAPDQEPSFVITMKEHLDLCGQLARAYGNDRFESLNPYNEMLYVVENHDRGWDDYDQNPGIDPSTGLPYLMSRTPAVESVKTNRGSPDFNEAHNGYCGLLSSMHTWGLYNKRYGFTQFVVRTRNTVSIQVADPNRPMVDKMLADEVVRQGRLKEGLAKSETGKGLDREQAPVPELQAAHLLRYAFALLPPLSCDRSRRRGLHPRPDERGERQQRHREESQ
jgi:hypothetical protein